MFGSLMTDSHTYRSLFFGHFHLHDFSFLSLFLTPECLMSNALSLSKNPDAITRNKFGHFSSPTLIWPNTCARLSKFVLRMQVLDACIRFLGSDGFQSLDWPPTQKLIWSFWWWEDADVRAHAYDSITSPWMLFISGLLAICHWIVFPAIVLAFEESFNNFTNAFIVFWCVLSFWLIMFLVLLQRI